MRIAQSLRARGQLVRLVAPALHEPMVQPTGIAFHGTAADPAVLDDPDLWHPVRGFAVVWRAVRPGLRELPGVLAQLDPGRRCVIIAHPLALPDAVLARDGMADSQQQTQTDRAPGARISVVAAYLAPSNIPTVHDPLTLGPFRVPGWFPHGLRRWLWSVVGARLIDPVALPEINAARATAQLAPVTSLFSFMREAPDLSLALFPAWFGPPKPDWSRPFVSGDFALFDPDPEAGFPAEVDEFLNGGEPPIIFTHGTGNRQSRRFFAHALGAISRLGRRAIFLTPHRDQLPDDLPPSVLWQPYLPLKRCLPRSAAIVHHGGVGTTAEALHAGVAQLIVPLAFDQFDNGARVQDLGAGAMLPHARLTQERLASALGQLLAAPAPVLAASSSDWDQMISAIEKMGNYQAGQPVDN